MLLGARRESIVNITEVGVFKGASALMWTDFFPNAHYWGVDNRPKNKAVSLLANSTRHTLVRAKSDVRSAALLAARLAPHSMDLVIDDGDHHADRQQRTPPPLAARPIWALYRIEGTPMATQGMPPMASESWSATRASFCRTMRPCLWTRWC